MNSFTDLVKKSKQKDTDHKKVKLAILADTASQLLRTAIDGMGVEYGINFDIYEADYNQIDSELMDKNSGYHQFEPEFTLIYESSQNLLDFYYKNPTQNFADDKIASIKSRIENSHPKSQILFFNFNDLDNQVFGNFAHKLEFSFPYQLNKLNFLLSELAAQNPRVNLIDIKNLMAYDGRKNAINNTFKINSNTEFDVSFLPAVANSVTASIAASGGKFKKCLILDLDNTLWGGVIGDDGLEKIEIGDLGIGKAFTQLQKWIKSLQQRGVILAVCSKNDEDKAKEPFEKHPEMILKPEDISVFVANWNNKADNIKSIQKILNIGFDSMVFLDDNPAERAIVKENIPEIEVPELPEDPAYYLDYLYGLNLFETNSFSENDIKRTEQYRNEAQRNLELTQFTNLDDFLGNLGMIGKVEDLNEFNLPRIAQLSQRSNQFNFRTIRYSENDLKELEKDPDYQILAFQLKDKYGDHGLISTVILKILNKEELFIENWMMSCRVLKRSMEEFILNELINFARIKNFKKIKGEYIATPKNNLVKDTFPTLGFEPIENDAFELDIENTIPLKTFIEKENDN